MNVEPSRMEPTESASARDSTVQDSPVEWVADHARRYVESGGTEGHIWRGVPTCLVTTTGRRTGIPRRTAVIYGRDGEHVIVIGSRGGSLHDPSWVINLRAQPAVDVMVGTETFSARARFAQGAERARLWKMMTQIYPKYASYQERTTRELPVVVLVPDDKSEAPIE